MQRLAYVVLVHVLLGTAAAPAFAASFTFTILATPGDGGLAAGINNAGQIVGSYSTGSYGHAFLLSGGQVTTIDPPGSVSAIAFDINDGGHIVGTFFDGSENHGFLLRDGRFEVIAPFGSPRSGADGINNAGEIVGSFVDAAGAGHGYLYSNGQFTTIDAPGDTFDIGLTDINDAGEIVGIFRDLETLTYQGFLLSGGHFMTIDLPGSIGTIIDGINNRGQLVGTFGDGTRGNGFLFDGQSFTTINPPGSMSARLFGINDTGVLVGGSVEDSTGRAFLATPVAEPISEPQTGMLFGTGTIALFGSRWWRRRRRRTNPVRP